MRWFVQALSVNPPPFWITFELDYRVMLFVLGLIVLASVFAGTLPAMHAARVSAGAALKDDSRSATSARLGRFSSGLVVAELAVSCGLLIAAGLMIKSVVQLKNVQMPFAIENILTARIDLPRTAYPDTASSIRFFEQLLPRLQAVPGVEAATLSDGLPAAGNGTISVQIEGKAYAQPSDYPLAREGIVTAGYFDCVRDQAVERTRIHDRRYGDQPAGGGDQPVIRSRALSEYRSDRPPDATDQAELQRTVADDRRRRAGSDHGRDRQTTMPARSVTTSRFRRATSPTACASRCVRVATRRR